MAKPVQKIHRSPRKQFAIPADLRPLGNYAGQIIAAMKNAHAARIRGK